MANIQDRHIVRAGDTNATTGTVYLYPVAPDGSRRLLLIEEDHEEAEGSTAYWQIPAGGTVDGRRDGYVAYTATPLPPGLLLTNINNGFYSNYAGAFGDHRPVNQVPYALRWREVLAAAADNLKNTHWANHFHMRENVFAFDPSQTALTHDQRVRVENTVHIFRNLIGALWQKIDAWANTDPPPATWKTDLAATGTTVRALVEAFCSLAGEGRGCVEHACDTHDIIAWEQKRRTQPTHAWYLDAAGGVGTAVAQTDAERANNLSAYRSALDYFGRTNGHEGDIHKKSVDDALLAIDHPIT